MPSATHRPVSTRFDRRMSSLRWPRRGTDSGSDNKTPRTRTNIVPFVPVVQSHLDMPTEGKKKGAKNKNVTFAYMAASIWCLVFAASLKGKLCMRACLGLFWWAPPQTTRVAASLQKKIVGRRRVEASLAQQHPLFSTRGVLFGSGAATLASPLGGGSRLGKLRFSSKGGSHPNS